MSLEIMWETESTVLLPGGGDAIRSTSEVLELDIIESDSYRTSAKITAHAVEQGVDITDHTEPEQDRITVIAALSERPMDINMVDGTAAQSVLLNTGNRASAQRPPTGTTRRADAFEELRNLVRNGTLVNVEGLIRPLEDYQIESVTAPRKTETAGLLEVDITFVEHRTAELDEVDAPSPRVERGRSGTDNGRESGSGDNDETASSDPSQRESGLLAGGRVVANALGIGGTEGIGAGLGG